MALLKAREKWLVVTIRMVVCLFAASVGRCGLHAGGKT